MSTTDLIVTPHPLTLHDQRQYRGVPLEPRERLDMLLRRHQVDLDGDEGWEVTIDGLRVPIELLPLTTPRSGHLVEVRRTAHKSALRLVALIAVMTLAAPLAAAVGFTAGTLAYTAATFAIQMIGAAIVNRVLGPKMPRTTAYDQQTATTYSLAGGRNRARHYEPLGLVLGVVKVTPDYGALPFSWFQGDEQYLYVRLHAGINCESVSDIKIGATTIGAYSEVTVEQSGFSGLPNTLQRWSTADTVAGATLDAPASPGAWTTRTSSASSMMLSVDLGVSLYKMNDDGSFTPATVTVEIERRLLPSGSWQPFSGVSAAVTFTSSSTKPLRRTITTDILTTGQYEVRARKVTANVSTTREANLVEWSALKSFQRESSDFTDQPQVGIRIRASGQLNGTLDEVSWVATARAVPVWTGATWLTQTTRNPGAQILQLARGIYSTSGRLMAGLGWADAQIDIEALKQFMVFCTAKGYTFDWWVDQPMSCMELLEAIAAAGMGSISQHTGKLGVVWLDSTRPIEAVVAMGNIKARSFRVDYTTRELAQEVEATYRDRDDGWLTKSLRVLAPGVTTPRDTARVQPIGPTTEAAVARAARLVMAQNIYQRKAVTWEMDLEHLTFHRYSLVACSHDMTQWGYSGRLRSAATVSGQVVLELDELVPANAGATVRAVGLRLPGEAQMRVFNVAAWSGNTHTLTLTTAWPGGVPLPGSSASNPAWDTIWVADFKATPGMRLCVVQIEPTADLGGARITAVPEPDEFWSYINTGAYSVPALGNGLGTVAASNVVATPDRVDLSFDGGTTLSVVFDVTGPYDHAQLWIGLSGQPLQFAGQSFTRRFDAVPVSAAGTYSIEVRPFDSLGRQGTIGSTSTVVSLTQIIGSLQASVTAAQSAASTAAANAASALSTLATIRSNGYIDASEKPALIREWNYIAGEYSPLSTQAAAYGISSEKTAFDAAYSALGSYLSALSPGWADTTTDTPITPATDAAKWSDYYSARGTLTKRIAEEAGKRAVWAQVQGSAAVDASIAAAQSAASAAQTSANAANAAIADSAADNKLSPTEKQRDKILFDAIVAEKSGIDAEADRYGISAEKTAYGSAYSTLYTYALGLLANVSTTSDIDGVAYRGYFASLYSARQTLLNKIAASAKALADSAVDLVLLTLGNVTIQGSTVTKTAGGGAWNGGVVTAQGSTSGAAVSWVPQQTTAAMVVGLSTTQASSGDSALIEYGIYHSGAGELRTSLSGTLSGVLSGYAAGDLLSVEHDGYRARFFRNGVLWAEVVSTPTGPLYGRASLYTQNGSLRALRFGSMSSVKDIGTTQLANDAAQKVVDFYDETGVSYSTAA